MGGRAPQHLFPLLYERRSEWVVTKAVGGRLPEHLKAVVMCCRPRRSRAIGVYGTTLSRFCVRGVSRGSECPPPLRRLFWQWLVRGCARVCRSQRFGWVFMSSVDAIVAILRIVPPRHAAHVSLAVHTGGGRGCCHACGLPGSGWLPPPHHVFVRVRGFWCCGRVRK